LFELRDVCPTQRRHPLTIIEVNVTDDALARETIAISPYSSYNRH
jgi:hypothetical protein